MSKYVDELIEVMGEIADAGWHKSTRKGNTGIGKTFEDLLMKEEDNHDLPDFYDIEIKTHETNAKSLLSLFTKSPTYPRSANTMLKNNYGTENEFGDKILHTTISGNKRTNSEKYSYDFKAFVNWEQRRVYLHIYDKSNNLVDDSVYWSFDALDKQIQKKLKFIAVVSAESKEEDGAKFYKYTDIDLVKNLSVDSLCQGIDDGNVKIDIRISTYKEGKNKGKTHDRGTAFRIKIDSLLNYADVENIV